MKTRPYFFGLLLLFLLVLIPIGCGKPSLGYKSVQGIMEDAVADSAWPGGVLIAGNRDSVLIHSAAGYHTYERQHKTCKDDIFDLASLTKVIGTTSAIMKLCGDSLISLDDPAVRYVPRLQGPTKVQTMLKKTITIRHLLTHTAGFEPFRLFYEMEGGTAARWDSVFRSPLVTKPGTATVYSDIGFMLLAKVVESVTGESIDRYLKRQIFDTLKMDDTHYTPPPSLLPRIVPTEYDTLEGLLVHGAVHDSNARSLGGVAGHAGLFSTAEDLSRFARMMLNGGELDGVRIFREATVARFTHPVSENSTRCLGWDSPGGESSGGIYLSPESYGHTGFTGTSIWIDPANDVFLIVLTNAVHPFRTRKNPGYYDWRQLVSSVAFEEMGVYKRNPDLLLKERWVERFGLHR